MTTHEIDQLNAKFAVQGHVTFAAIQGGLVAAEIRNAHASATVALHGGHVLAFQPHGEQPVLWVSRESRFQEGAPIRGGIPICWPWFGKHADGSAKPFHGFARTALWEVSAVRGLRDGSTELDLRLRDSDATRGLWPQAFELRLRVTVSRTLHVALAMRNTGEKPFTCTSALHSYFRVSEAADIQVWGLDKCAYLDTVPEPPARGVQDGPVRIGAETDRVYVDTEAECAIEDPGLKRRVRVAKQGSRSTVVWNPWIAKAARMPDFGKEEYHEMLCLETANAGEDAREIPPASEHRIAAIIHMEPLAG
jgi:glucose-6-phosphate 1-epimerase